MNMAAQMIEAGDADIVVAGGTGKHGYGSVRMMKGRYGYRMGYPMGKSELVDTMVNDALWDANGCNMHGHDRRECLHQRNLPEEVRLQPHHP